MDPYDTFLTTAITAFQSILTAQATAVATPGTAPQSVAQAIAKSQRVFIAAVNYYSAGKQSEQSGP